VNSDHIRDYWESQAKTHGQSHWASWGDNWMIELEIEAIGRHIKDNDHVLDVGCANGFSTFRQAASHRLASITGVDLATSMIAVARQTKLERNLGEDIQFVEGDVRSLCFPDGAFDVAYTTRVLINLPSWEQQRAGIGECLRVVKPGGRIVFSEGFWEPLVLLNAMRALRSLPPLVEPDFNRYLKLSGLEAHLRELGVEYEVDDFSSIYYLGSRFLRELVTDAAAYPGFTNPINALFFEIERQYSGGGMGIQKAVTVTKGPRR
jgi:SAM-dependent methyltransferase